MPNCYNQGILDALEMTRELIELAARGDGCCRDNGCAVLFGVVRDCAYRIRAEAERERRAHLMRGIWEEGLPAPPQNMKKP